MEESRGPGGSGDFAGCRSAPAPDPFRDLTLIDDSEIDDVKGAIGMDFGNYTIGGLIPHRQNYDFENETYRSVRRQIEGRIAELGYSVSRFKDVDSRIKQEEWRVRREGSKTDRYGKKYAWIAYFENVRIETGSRVVARVGWRGADVARDIDPSFPESPRKWAPELGDPFAADGPTPGPLWMKSGVTPAYDHLLYCERVDGKRGPWVLLDGYIEQSSQEDDRRIFTFLRGVFVRSDDVVPAARAFSSLRYPGNFEIPGPAEDHYLYAGEIPWSRRFGGELRGPDGRRRGDRREDAFSAAIGAIGIGVEIPVRRFGWESYHSELNQVSGVLVPAPGVCDSLG